MFEQQERECYEEWLVKQEAHAARESVQAALEEAQLAEDGVT